MKAQRVKNAVIVPVGRQGRLRREAARPPIPAALRAEVEACYRLFIGALLDVTDNLVDGTASRSSRRPSVVRYDGDDPYLVVAADKGTATFSDIANEIALRARLLARRRVRVGRSSTATTTRRWASPPAARGSRCAGTSGTSTSIPTATTSPSSASATCRATCSATACCSREHIQLVAAFDHRHVFLDPESRRRPRRSRSASACSTLPALVVGRLRRGADLARAAACTRAPLKSIPITPEVRARARHRPTTSSTLHAGRADPRDPARAGRPALQRRHRHLREGAHRDARRRRRQGQRRACASTARDLRCRARRRGRQPRLHPARPGRVRARTAACINTDAIDNSAGVDTSDHEVNIKILLDGAVRDGRARREPSATRCSSSMTDEVAALVLRDNYRQNRALDNARRPGGRDGRRARALHARARAAEAPRPRRSSACPTDETARRPPQRGPRPDRARARGAARATPRSRSRRSLLAVAAARRRRLPPRARPLLPHAVRERFLDTHPHATRCGARSPRPRSSTASSTGPAPRSRSASARRPARRRPTSCARHEAARAIFDQDALWRDIEALDATVDVDVQTEMYLRVAELVERVAPLAAAPPARNRCRSRRRSRSSRRRRAAGGAMPGVARGATATGWTPPRDAHRHEAFPAELAARIAALDLLPRRARHRRARRRPHASRSSTSPSCTTRSATGSGSTGSSTASSSCRAPTGGTRSPATRSAKTSRRQHRAHRRRGAGRLRLDDPPRRPRTTRGPLLRRRRSSAPSRSSATSRRRACSISRRSRSRSRAGARHFV